MSESLAADEIVAELRNDIREQNQQLEEAYAEIDAKDKLLKEKDKEIAELKKAAASAQSGGGGAAGESLTGDQIVEELRNDIREQNQQLDEAYAEIDAKVKEIADLKKQLAAGSTAGAGGGSGSSAADAEEIKKLKEQVAKLKAAMNALLDA
ncbi:unnamed protein product [Linum tenue]|uniref:Uncharacterized protein n=1 Tax=Linum tenue TaxID=586396 RepID=A0AAV0KHQ8_9ROSI|nr:unnamed protein product [Linum tenue]